MVESSTWCRAGSSSGSRVSKSEASCSASRYTGTCCGPPTPPPSDLFIDLPSIDMPKWVIRSVVCI
eukprot:1189513-Prorocentrum_minimum.AAC.1